MESVAWVASVNDGATRKVALVTDLVSKLGDARIFTMGKFKACEKSINVLKVKFNRKN